MNAMSATLIVQPTITSVVVGAGDLRTARERLEQGGSLDQIANDLGLDSAETALGALANTLGMQVVDLSRCSADPEVVKAFPAKLVHRYGVFPLGDSDDSLLLVTSNPFDLHAIDAVSGAIGRRVTPLLAAADELEKLIKSHLGVGAETVDGLMAAVEDEQIELLDEVQFDDSEASEMAQQASVVRLVNEILSEAVLAKASDIHIEAQESGIKIRYRIDGVLQRQPTPPEMNRFHPAIVSRLKIMSRMNIAEKRVPQDGRIKLRVAGLKWTSAYR